MTEELFLYKEQGVVANYGRLAKFFDAIRNPKEYAVRSALIEQSDMVDGSRIRSPHLITLADEVTALYLNQCVNTIKLLGGDSSYYAERLVDGSHSDVVELREFGVKPVEFILFVYHLENRGMVVKHDCRRPSFIL